MKKALGAGRVFQRIRDVDAGEAQAHLISRRDPVSPSGAKEARITGTVVVVALIAPDGEVRIARAIDGPEPLRAAAEEAVRAWRYRPFLVQGQPGTVQTKVTLNFQLDK